MSHHQLNTCQTIAKVTPAPTTQNNKKPGNVDVVGDYVFICFMLGNDFLPHFPALNIRKGGIDKLLMAYSHIFGASRDGNEIFDGTTINWANFRKLVAFLANEEEESIKDEHMQRNGQSRKWYPQTTPEERIRKFNALPTYDRDIEIYINPLKDGWVMRYYTALFPHITELNMEEQVKNICINYLEGLEWTSKYYSKGCPDWRWTYKYAYPPLLSDLVRYIPVLNTPQTVFIRNIEPNPVSKIVQLCYVLPKRSLEKLLPPAVRNIILETFPSHYAENCRFLWAYCKFFWESHVVFDNTSVLEMEMLLSNAEKDSEEIM